MRLSELSPQAAEPKLTWPQAYDKYYEKIIEAQIITPYK